MEVIISLSKTSAESKKLKGEFKRSYTVRGLNEKTKDSYRESSSSTGIVLRENSSVNTKELTDTQVGEWDRVGILKIILKLQLALISSMMCG